LNKIRTKKLPRVAPTVLTHTNKKTTERVTTMKPNLNNVEAIIRITLGLTGLAWITARWSQRRNSPLSMWIAMLFAKKVAEGITKFCPLKALYRIEK
jgi:hypothetical protein